MIEKDLQSIFNRKLPNFIDKFPNTKQSIVIESKLIDLTKRKSIPFDEIKSHQTIALTQAKMHYLVYKIPDDSEGTKPFDLTIWRNCLSYICLFWYKPRKLKEAHLIPLKDFIKVVKHYKRKSINYIISSKVSEFIVTLK